MTKLTAISPGQVNADILRLTRKLYEMAEAGKLRNIAVAAEMTEGRMHRGFYYCEGSNLTTLIGVLEMVKMDVACESSEVCEVCDE